MSFAERAGNLFSSSDCFPNGCHLPAGALLGHEKFLLHHAGKKSGEERPGLACLYGQHVRVVSTCSLELKAIISLEVSG